MVAPAASGGHRAETQRYTLLAGHRAAPASHRGGRRVRGVDGPAAGRWRGAQRRGAGRLERSLGADTWSATGSTGRMDEEMIMKNFDDDDDDDDDEWWCIMLSLRGRFRNRMQVVEDVELNVMGGGTLEADLDSKIFSKISGRGVMGSLERVIQGYIH